MRVFPYLRALCHNKEKSMRKYFDKYEMKDAVEQEIVNYFHRRSVNSSFDFI